MPETGGRDLQHLLDLLFVAHPWHGLSAGPEAPDTVTVFVELVPADMVKFELDKGSGLLKLDRPQRYSSLSPVPYGFVPRTLSDEATAALAQRGIGRTGLRGDQDPLDICVITERTLNQGGVIVRARPIGGLRMLDGDEVDDKIIAVLESDPTYQDSRELEHCPAALLDRIEHYFLTYKDMPGTTRRKSELAGRYDAATTREVIRASQQDYRARYGDLETMLGAATHRAERGGASTS